MRWLALVLPLMWSAAAWAGSENFPTYVHGAGAATTPLSTQCIPIVDTGGTATTKLCSGYAAAVGAAASNATLTIAGHLVALGGSQAIACGDLSNGATGCSTATGTSGATIPLLNAANAWSAPQRVKGGSLTISTATFTPDLNTQQDFEILLVHASCPCTIANPSNISSAAADHQHGVIRITQSSTGSDTVGTWGSQWIAAGGTSTLSLSSGANAQDYFAYDVVDSTHILIAPVALNASH